MLIVWVSGSKIDEQSQDYQPYRFRGKWNYGAGYTYSMPKAKDNTSSSMVSW